MAQGSCLGPLLFIIFVNDLYQLPLCSRLILFADDTTMFHSHSSQNFLKYTLEHDLDKTVGIKFWENKAHMELQVEDIIIQMTNFTKFLGVHINFKLDWHMHINHLLDTLNTNRRMLSLDKTYWILNALKHLIYYGHIHSHILYGISVWGTMIPQNKIKQNLQDPETVYLPNRKIQQWIRHNAKV